MCGRFIGTVRPSERLGRGLPGTGRPSTARPYRRRPHRRRHRGHVERLVVDVAGRKLIEAGRVQLVRDALPPPRLGPDRRCPAAARLVRRGRVAVPRRGRRRHREVQRAVVVDIIRGRGSGACRVAGRRAVMSLTTAGCARGAGPRRRHSSRHAAVIRRGRSLRDDRCPRDVTEVGSGCGCAGRRVGHLVHRQREENQLTNCRSLRCPCVIVRQVNDININHCLHRNSPGTTKPLIHRVKPCFEKT